MASDTDLTDLARAALGRWDGNFGAPELFKNRENAVFSVRREDGARFALRVHRAGYHSDAALRSELYWMRELDRAGIAVPSVVPAKDGSLFVRIDLADTARQVDMIGWLAGAPVGEAGSGPAYHHRLGALAARLHLRGSQISLPADFTRHSWDEEGLLGERPVWGRFLDLPALSADQHALLREAADAAKAGLAMYGKTPDRFGMIHADLIRDNVLENEGALQAIDFDDSGFGWYMFELATILCANLDRADYSETRRQLLDGYGSVRPLGDTDVAHLPLFMFLRATTYLGWLQTRAETSTAREKAAMHIDRACRLAAAYLAHEGDRQ
ncbi:phosphotransferase enzyme family protein [Sphingosinicella soli]|uniref:Ser/Thr protein kinase RdoA (MazF antagonist) n=1 Tax=Sphingosinicella soli TaxID=333708 RepID=A0A7W7F5W4_9SPHN|nr:phosphotransferase [Sphingosinicella soli]MBB4631069.1 Ser/Thr protein kinase RdoA (MazF antagonist) [Sphingosinicella soli]